MKRSQRNINDFFSKKPKDSSSEATCGNLLPNDATRTTSVDLPSAEAQSSGSCELSPDCEVNDQPLKTIALPRSEEIPVMDFSKFVSKELVDTEKHNVIKDLWKPPHNYKFPWNDSVKKQRRFSYAWLEKYRWLAYSQKMDGVFCIFCSLFATASAGGGKGGHQRAKLLISEPYRNWKDCGENFRYHQEGELHKTSECKYREFLCVQNGQKEPVHVLLNTEKKKQLERYRVIIHSVIETILVLGRQGLALRGHKETETSSNPGNFLVFLKHRCKYDQDLNAAMSETWKNAKYTSPDIQNQIIEIIGNKILVGIKKKVTRVSFFTVLADEATDCTMTQQLVILLRYLDYNEDTKKAIVREDFIAFVKATDLTGKGLARSILNTLEEADLDVQYLVGQGYDGAKAMSGHIKGVQAEVKKKCPAALYVHCCSHILNLVCVQGTAIFKTTVTQLQQVVFFFTYNGARKTLFKQQVEACGSLKDSRKTQLIKLCPTRWVESHAAFIRFLELLQPIIMTLDILAEDAGSAETRSNAMCYSSMIRQFPFLISLHILSNLSCQMKHVSEGLQATQMDLDKCFKNVQSLKIELENMRADSSVFNKIFTEAEATAVALGTNVQLPRRVNSTQPVKEYYRDNYFNKLFSNVLQELDIRFSKHHSDIFQLQKLLPGRASSDEADRLAETFLVAYGQYVEVSEQELSAEIARWLRSWSSIPSSDYPKTVLDAVDQCDSTFYPEVNKLIRILATLPVTTASAERSFSMMRRVKNYLRSTMSDERFTALSLINLHRDMDISIPEIFKTFDKNRRANKQVSHLYFL